MLILTPEGWALWALWLGAVASKWIVAAWSVGGSA